MRLRDSATWNCNPAGWAGQASRKAGLPLGSSPGSHAARAVRPSSSSACRATRAKLRWLQCGTQAPLPARRRLGEVQIELPAIGDIGPATAGRGHLSSSRMWAMFVSAQRLRCRRAGVASEHPQKTPSPPRTQCPFALGCCGRFPRLRSVRSLTAALILARPHRRILLEQSNCQDREPGVAVSRPEATKNAGRLKSFLCPCSSCQSRVGNASHPVQFVQQPALRPHRRNPASSTRTTRLCPETTVMLTVFCAAAPRTRSSSPVLRRLSVRHATEALRTHAWAR